MLKQDITNDKKDERKRQRICFLEEVKKSLSYALDPNPPVPLFILLYLSATNPQDYANLPTTITGLLREKERLAGHLSEEKKDEHGNQSLRRIEGEISLYQHSLPDHAVLAQNWFHTVLYSEKSSQFKKICETLALLPDDYLEGILRDTGVTIQALREKAFPGVQICTYQDIIDQGLDDSNGADHHDVDVHLLTRKGSSASFSSSSSSSTTTTTDPARRQSFFSKLMGGGVSS